MLVPSRDFWRAIDGSRADGVLVLSLLQSWKRVGDHVGMHGVDIASGVFAVVCELATARAATQSTLALNLFGSYWGEPAAAREALEFLDRWFPLEARAPHAAIPIEVATITVQRSRGEAGRLVYASAQASFIA